VNSKYIVLSKMNHRKSIEELLELYLTGHLTPASREELYRRINEDAEQEFITAWFYRMWDETHSEKPDKKSAEAYLKLKSKLGLKDSNAIVEKVLFPERKSYNSIYKAVLRYAAVLVLSFGLAWLYFSVRHTQNLSHDIKKNEIIVPNGSKSFLTLEDGSKIWLNSGSRLAYTDFANTTSREVYLEGEAFFDVTGNKRKPFIVHTSHLKLKVLGTKFNVKSYPSEKITETILVSGKVEIEELNASSENKQQITLRPFQKATYSVTTGKIAVDDKKTASYMKPQVPSKIEIIEKINPELYTSWKDDKLIFSNERLESLIVRLERWYNVDITLNDSLLKNYRYTGKFEKENIEQALQALKLATPLEYSIDKNKITIYASAGKNK
jgi:ferric-dicitrate binding protein FerR (iron transport regulator)